MAILTQARSWKAEEVQGTEVVSNASRALNEAVISNLAVPVAPITYGLNTLKVFNPAQHALVGNGKDMQIIEAGLAYVTNAKKVVRKDGVVQYVITYNFNMQEITQYIKTYVPNASQARARAVAGEMDRFNKVLETYFPEAQSTESEEEYLAAIRNLKPSALIGKVVYIHIVDRHARKDGEFIIMDNGRAQSFLEPKLQPAPSNLPVAEPVKTYWDFANGAKLAMDEGYLPGDVVGTWYDGQTLQQDEFVPQHAYNHVDGTSALEQGEKMTAAYAMESNFSVEQQEKRFNELNKSILVSKEMRDAVDRGEMFKHIMPATIIEAKVTTFRSGAVGLQVTYETYVGETREFKFNDFRLDQFKAVLRTYGIFEMETTFELVGLNVAIAVSPDTNGRVAAELVPNRYWLAELKNELHLLNGVVQEPTQPIVEVQEEEEEVAEEATPEAREEEKEEPQARPEMSDFSEAMNVVVTKEEELASDFGDKMVVVSNEEQPEVTPVPVFAAPKANVRRQYGNTNIFITEIASEFDLPSYVSPELLCINEEGHEYEADVLMEEIEDALFDTFAYAEKHGKKVVEFFLNPEYALLGLELRDVFNAIVNVFFADCGITVEVYSIEKK